MEHTDLNQQFFQQAILNATEAGRALRKALNYGDGQQLDNAKKQVAKSEEALREGTQDLLAAGKATMEQYHEIQQALHQLHQYSYRR